MSAPTLESMVGDFASIGIVDIEPANLPGAQKVSYIGQKDHFPVLIQRASESSNPKGQEHRDRGYGIGNEIAILEELSPTDAARNNISLVLDFPWIRGVNYIIQEYYEGAITLKQHLENLRDGAKKGMSYADIKEVFPHLLKAVLFLEEKEIYHRDMHPENILYLPKENRLILTDFGLAKKKTQASEEFQSTCQSRWITDPRLSDKLVDEPKQYDQRTVMHELSSILYYMATGEPAFFTDTNAGTIQTDSAKYPDITRPDGKIDEPKYQKALKKMLKKVPRKLRGTIENGLGFNPTEAPSTLAHYKDRFNEATTRGPGKLIAYASVATLALAGLVGTFLGDELKIMNRELGYMFGDDRHIITQKWSPYEDQVISNLGSLDTIVEPHEEGEKDNIARLYRPEFVSVKNTNKIQIKVTYTESPRERSKNEFDRDEPLRLNGRVYIEGWDSEPFFQEITLLSRIGTSPFYSEKVGDPTVARAIIEIPPDSSEYLAVAIELDTPSFIPDHRMASKDIKFSKQGILARKKTLLSKTGESPASIWNIQFYGGKLRYNTFPGVPGRHNIAQPYDSEMYIPDFNWSSDDITLFSFPKLPEGNTGTYNTVIGVDLFQRREEEVIRTCYIPLHIYNSKGIGARSGVKGNVIYSFPVPGKDFYKRIAEVKNARD